MQSKNRNEVEASIYKEFERTIERLRNEVDLLSTYRVAFFVLVGGMAALVFITLILFWER